MGEGRGVDNGRGRQVKFYPYKKGGPGESFSHVEGGGGGVQNSFNTVLMRGTYVLPMLRKGAKSFYPYEGGTRFPKVLPCL